MNDKYFIKKLRVNVDDLKSDVPQTFDGVSFIKMAPSASMEDWLSESSNNQSTTRDLVLKPIDIKPGIYENEDGNPYMVCQVKNQSYLMIWNDVDIEDAKVDHDDLVFKDCYIKDIKMNFKNNSVGDGVMFEKLELNYESPFDIIKEPKE